MRPARISSIAEMQTGGITALARQFGLENRDHFKLGGSSDPTANVTIFVGRSDPLCQFDG